MLIPILMYHDVVSDRAKSNHVGSHEMTPLYNVSVSQFSSQMAVLADNGFTCPALSDISSLKPDGKYAVLTFDDGLKGNYIEAFPILKKYGFKGNFFVVTGSIGTSRFMTWDQLKELVADGMYVQSHTESHKSLQVLDKEQVRFELTESKRRLEKKLRIAVNAISFPHGSYNKEILSIAEQEGYDLICTSDVRREKHDNFLRKPVVLGRFAMTTEIDILAFRKIINGSTGEYIKRRAVKEAKNAVKKILGVQGYRKIYRYIFNIKPQKR